MAKGDTETARKMIQTESGTVNQQHNAIYDTMMAERPDVYNRGVGTYNDIRTGANQLYQNPLDPTVIANLRALSKPGSGGGGGGGGESGGGGGGVQSPQTSFQSSPGSRWGDLIGTAAGAAKSGLVDMGKLEAAIPGFTEISQTGGYDPAAIAGIQGSINALKGFEGTGGFDPAMLAAIQGDIGALRKIGETGGLNPAAQAQLEGLVNQLEAMGKTGGVSDESINRIRGNGIFDEFAKTGGYTPRDLQLMRAKATSVIPALYARENEKLNRLASIRGGYAPGAGAQRAQMIRSTGQALSDASREGELGVQGAVQAGRKWGGEQMTASEQALAKLLQEGKATGLIGAGNLGLGLQDLISGNKLAGLTAAGRLGTDLETSAAGNRITSAREAANAATTLAQNLAANKLTGLKGITETHGQAQGLRQTGMLGGMNAWASGLSGQSQEEQAAAALAAQQQAAADAAAASRYATDLADARFWAGLGSENEQYIGSMLQGGQLGSLGVLGNLYGTAPGELGMYTQGLLGAAGQRGQLQGDLIRSQTSLANQPGVFGQIMQGLGGGAGLLAGISGITGQRNATPGGGASTKPTVWGVGEDEGYRGG